MSEVIHEMCLLKVFDWNTQFVLLSTAPFVQWCFVFVQERVLLFQVRVMKQAKQQTPDFPAGYWDYLFSYIAYQLLN